MPDTAAALDRVRAAVPTLAVLGSVGGVVALLAGAVGARWVLLAAVIFSCGSAALPERTPTVHWYLFATVSSTWRLLLCWTGVLALGAREWTEPLVVVTVVLAALGISVVRAVALLAVGRVRRTRDLAVETRNVDLSALRLGAAPARRVLTWGDRVQVVTPVLLLAPATLAEDSAGGVLLGGAAALVLSGLWTAWMLLEALRVRRARPTRALALVRAFLEDYRPTVVLYHAENAAGAYQADVWLATMERIPQRVVVIVRSAAALRRMGTTTLPVVCVPRTVDFLSLPFTSARAALYVANVGPNIHLLRLPHVRSAFIGHGDSDKSASVNPFGKVYDELWVAGSAARQRWAAADVGIDLDRVVEVGRPQLDPLAGDHRPAEEVRTVLYAPTWEGWNDSQEYGSVGHQGPDVVRALLDAPSRVRVLYKPHPLTGTRDPAVAAKHRQIVELLEAANKERGLVGSASFDAPFVASLAGAEDAAEASVLAGRPGVMVAAVQAEEQLRAAQRRYLDALPPGLNVVVEGGDLDLYALFAYADVLVTDVSSVLTDFQATGRPYATCNTMGIPDSVFRTDFPASAAGVVLGPDGSGLDELVAVACDPRADTRAPDRASLRSELLGVDVGHALTRFAGAVDALVRSGEARAARHRPHADVADLQPEADGTGSLEPGEVRGE